MSRDTILPQSDLEDGPVDPGSFLIPQQSNVTTPTSSRLDEEPARQLFAATKNSMKVVRLVFRIQSQQSLSVGRMLTWCCF